MNADFSRTLALLRQEKEISQRKAAADLGISQALLSHYENGIREPGLAFVKKACDYYHVSADYLLGRTLDRDGGMIDSDELYDSSDEKGTLRGSIAATLQKKLLVNTVNLLFELLGKTNCREAVTAAGQYLGAAIYPLYRALHRAAGGKDAFFALDAAAFSAGASDAAMLQSRALYRLALERHAAGDGAFPAMDAETLTGSYPGLAQSMTQVLPAADPKRVKEEIENILAIPAEDAPEISAKLGINIDAVLEDIVRNLPAPKGDPNAPLKALIFDSYYDAYRGVIVYMRLKDGTIRPGMEIRMMATGATFKVLECGLMRPLGLEPAKQLEAGQVGYFTASIKDVHETQIGDTVTGAENPASEPLPGYRKVRSMVYCGIYTEDGSKYPDLRDALEKLQLNDASLTFEPESSVALGFGFRCGFLGMLHMEVIQERLEREFDLDLVTTLPSVIYEVYKTDGTMVRVDNPHNYPDPSVIEHAEEPYVKVTIVTPPDYVGNIMPMCQERRGEFKDMQYLDTYLVELHYEMPLNEIIYDFFDALKANTKGYASLDYELSGYRRSELVKVDMLLNGDQVDALSFIAHKDKAYPRARRLCEKLKDNIPRQLFEVPVQAAIGGRVIARETVKAMRKDVLAKCYGGDITRKKKLLEKQKEGKKKMRNLGTVQVPTEAFLAVLKLDE